MSASKGSIEIDVTGLLPVLRTVKEGDVVAVKKSLLAAFNDSPVEVELVERAEVEEGTRYTVVLYWMGIRLGQFVATDKEKVHG